MSRKKRRFHDETGLTLLELMFAAGVMTVAFVLLFQSIFAISNARAVTEQRALVASHLSSVMEELTNASYDSLLAYTPPEFSGLRSENVEVRCYYEDGTLVTLPVVELDAPLPSPMEVEVVITWRSVNDRELTASATTVHRR